MGWLGRRLGIVGTVKRFLTLEGQILIIGNGHICTNMGRFQVVRINRTGGQQTGFLVDSSANLSNTDTGRTICQMGKGTNKTRHFNSFFQLIRVCILPAFYLPGVVEHISAYGGFRARLGTC